MTIEELNTIRKNQGISYSTLSKMSNVPLRTIENIFGGKTPTPRIDTLKSIQEALVGVEQKEKPLDISSDEEELLFLYRGLPKNLKQHMVIYAKTLKSMAIKDTKV